MLENIYFKCVGKALRPRVIVLGGLGQGRYLNKHIRSAFRSTGWEQF